MRKNVLSIVPRGYLPELSGGLEICASETIEFLVSEGWQAGIAASTTTRPMKKYVQRLKRFLFGPFPTQYKYKNHNVYTDTWHISVLDTLVEKLNPTFVICHVSMCDDLIEKVISLNTPTLFYIHSREISPLFGRFPINHRCFFACESRYIKAQFQHVSKENIDVIRPLLERNKFQTVKTGESIIVVNPHPKKGGEIVTEIAKHMPTFTFLIVGGWANAQTDEMLTRIESQLSQLPNIKRITHVEDMRTVFQQGRCLLMPCIVEEAYGRTAAEALIAGLPVVSSNRGALPETVGEGGVIIDPESPITTWINAIKRLFTDQSYYNDLSKKARETSLAEDRSSAFIQSQLLNIINTGSVINHE